MSASGRFLPLTCDSGSIWSWSMGLTARSRRLNIDAVIAAVPGLRSRPVEGHVDVLSFAQLHGRQLGEVQTQAGVARAKVGDLLPAVHSIVHERGLGKADAK